MATQYTEYIEKDGKRIPKPQTRTIWKVFIILLVVTVLEFVIAFTISAGTLRTSIFVGMTILKSFYIVGEFMHLAHEVKSLIWTILIPTVFVVWLILALLLEGGYMAA
jgi:cytochrome c oxidase subunit 4